MPEYLVYNPGAMSVSDAKRERDRRLLETDWTQMPDAIGTRISAEASETMRAYRQAVYDAVVQFELTGELVFPERPSGI